MRRGGDRRMYRRGVENGRRGLLHCVTRVLIRPCVLDSDIVSERGIMCLFQQVVRLNHYHNARAPSGVSLTLDTKETTLNIREFRSNINSYFGHRPKDQYFFNLV